MRRPRTCRQLMAKHGLRWRDHLPPGTVYAEGIRKDGIRQGFYYVPDGSDAQARMLAKREIDHSQAREL